MGVIITNIKLMKDLKEVQERINLMFPCYRNKVMMMNRKIKEEF